MAVVADAASPAGIVVSPDGSRVYVARSGGGRVMDAATNVMLATAASPTDPYGLAVGPDGSRLYVTSGSGLSVLDTTSLAVVATVPFEPSRGVAVTTDGSGSTSRMDAPSARSPRRHGSYSTPYGNGIALTPDGSRLYVANGEMSIVDTASDTFLGIVPGNGFGLEALGQFIRPATACGSNVVGPGETCDDGNLVNGDGCDANYRPTACGNGVVTAGEQCDDGNLVGHVSAARSQAS
ncbi:MAG: hypothetical protein ABIR79_25335 [Candidatus Binatia bacterium]